MMPFLLMVRQDSYANMVPEPQTPWHPGILLLGAYLEVVLSNSIIHGEGGTDRSAAHCLKRCETCLSLLKFDHFPAADAKRLNYTVCAFA